MANVNCLEGMRCPKCKHADEVLVVVKIWTSLRDDGTDHVADSIQDASVDYDDDSSACCPACGYFGNLRDWKRKGKKKTKTKRGEAVMCSKLADPIVVALSGGLVVDVLTKDKRSYILVDYDVEGTDLNDKQVVELPENEGGGCAAFISGYETTPLHEAAPEVLALLQKRYVERTPE